MSMPARLFLSKSALSGQRVAIWREDEGQYENAVIEDYNSDEDCYDVSYGVTKQRASLQFHQFTVEEDGRQLVLKVTRCSKVGAHLSAGGSRKASRANSSELVVPPGALSHGSAMKSAAASGPPPLLAAEISGTGAKAMLGTGRSSQAGSPSVSRKSSAGRLVAALQPPPDVVAFKSAADPQQKLSRSGSATGDGRRPPQPPMRRTSSEKLQIGAWPASAALSPPPSAQQHRQRAKSIVLDAAESRRSSGASCTLPASAGGSAAPSPRGVQQDNSEAAPTMTGAMQGESSAASMQQLALSGGESRAASSRGSQLASRASSLSCVDSADADTDVQAVAADAQPAAPLSLANVSYLGQNPLYGEPESGPTSPVAQRDSYGHSGDDLMSFGAIPQSVDAAAEAAQTVAFETDGISEKSREEHEEHRLTQEPTFKSVAVIVDDAGAGAVAETQPPPSPGTLSFFSGLKLFQTGSGVAGSACSSKAVSRSDSLRANAILESPWTFPAGAAPGTESHDQLVSPVDAAAVAQLWQQEQQEQEQQAQKDVLVAKQEDSIGQPVLQVTAFGGNEEDHETQADASARESEPGESEVPSEAAATWSGVSNAGGSSSLNGRRVTWAASEVADSEAGGSVSAVGSRRVTVDDAAVGGSAAGSRRATATTEDGTLGGGVTAAASWGSSNPPESLSLWSIGVTSGRGSGGGWSSEAPSGRASRRATGASDGGVTATTPAAVVSDGWEQPDTGTPRSARGPQGVRLQGATASAWFVPSEPCSAPDSRRITASEAAATAASSRRSTTSEAAAAAAAAARRSTDNGIDISLDGGMGASLAPAPTDDPTAPEDSNNINGVQQTDEHSDPAAAVAIAVGDEPLVGDDDVLVPPASAAVAEEEEAATGLLQPAPDASVPINPFANHVLFSEASAALRGINPFASSNPFADEQHTPRGGDEPAAGASQFATLRRTSSPFATETVQQQQQQRELQLPSSAPEALTQVDAWPAQQQQQQQLEQNPFSELRTAGGSAPLSMPPSVAHSRTGSVTASAPAPSRYAHSRSASGSAAVSGMFDAALGGSSHRSTASMGSFNLGTRRASAALSREGSTEAPAYNPALEATIGRQISAAHQASRESSSDSVALAAAIAALGKPAFDVRVRVDEELQARQQQAAEDEEDEGGRRPLIGSNWRDSSAADEIQPASVITSPHASSAATPAGLLRMRTSSRQLEGVTVMESSYAYGDNDKLPLVTRGKTAVQIQKRAAQSLPMTRQEERAQLRRLLLSSGLSSAVEWYDNMVLIYMGATMAAQFFPLGTGNSQLLGLLAVFLAGFVARPLGGAIFSRFATRTSRKRALVWSALLMAMPTALIGCLPNYEKAKLGAPIGLALLRLAQGFTVGGDFSSTLVFLVEHAEPQHRGLRGSAGFVGVVLGMLSAAVTCAAVHWMLPAAAVASWGWRLPFFLALPGSLFAALSRRSVDDPEDFMTDEERQERQFGLGTVLRVLLGNVHRLLMVMALLSSAVAGLFIIGAMLPVYFSLNTGVDPTAALSLHAANLVVLLGLMPLAGWAGDKYGRLYVLLTAVLFTAVLSYPLFVLFSVGVAAADWVGQLLLALPLAVFLGTAPAAAVELLPTGARCTGIAIAYTIGIVAIGAPLPVLAVALIQKTATAAIPAVLLIAAAVLTGASLSTLPRR